MTRPDLDAIRERAKQAEPKHGYEAAGTGFHNDYCRDVPALLAYIEELEAGLGGDCPSCTAAIEGGGVRLCRDCGDAMAEAGRRHRERESRPPRALTPIERMVDEACARSSRIIGD